MEPVVFFPQIRLNVLSAEGWPFFTGGNSERAEKAEYHTILAAT
jgi:hypothetical protein